MNNVFILVYPLLALASIAIDLVCKFFLNWIVAAFSNHLGNLPRGLRWFQTFDASLDEGMLARRRELMQPVPSSDWADFNPYPRTWFELYKNRALWLFRNTGYGFDYYLLGVTWKPDEWRVLKFIQNDSLILFMAVGRGFNLYAHGRYGMVKLGWKAWNVFNKSTGRFDGTWGDGGKIPITFSVNPFKKRGT